MSDDASMLHRPPLLTLALQAAIRLHEGGAYATMPRPNRHHDIIRLLGENGWARTVNGPEQGFCYAGRFISREDAARLVGKPGKLFTEDLW